MRISDWSSDVCSSDLALPPLPHDRVERPRAGTGEDQVEEHEAEEQRCVAAVQHREEALRRVDHEIGDGHHAGADEGGRRSEERRVGKESVSTCRSRWSSYHQQKTTTTSKCTTN